MGSNIRSMVSISITTTVQSEPKRSGRPKQNTNDATFCILQFLQRYPDYLPGATHHRLVLLRALTAADAEGLVNVELVAEGIGSHCGEVSIVEHH